MSNLSHRTDPFGLSFPVDRLFGRFFGNDPVFAELRPLATNGDTLAIDVSDDGTNFVVRASLPGVAKDKIEVDVHDEVLTIRASTEESTEERTETYLRRERRVGELSRTVRLPEAVDDEKAKAELNDGVLTLTLPKRAETGRRRLTVN